MKPLEWLEVWQSFVDRPSERLNFQIIGADDGTGASLYIAETDEAPPAVMRELSRGRRVEVPGSKSLRAIRCRDLRDAKETAQEIADQWRREGMQ